MNIENDVFARTHVIFDKLESYGFTKENNRYIYSTIFMNKNFQADIIIDEAGQVSGKVIDLEFNEEYMNLRNSQLKGQFVSDVRKQYQTILEDIKTNCFIQDYFISKQANRIAKYIIDKYHDYPEFLWEKFKGTGVFRNKQSAKWYAAILDIDKSKINYGTGPVEVIDVKVPLDVINKLTGTDGYFEAYHMNKKHWITIVLDDTVYDDEICALIDSSYLAVK